MKCLMTVFKVWGLGKMQDYWGDSSCLRSQKKVGLNVDILVVVEVLWLNSGMDGILGETLNVRLKQDTRWPECTGQETDHIVYPFRNST